ncbi:MAG TPA: ABC transporter permease [Patescibacteria group bacterium]|nr:ABC transporter permease [Patescibacteria group bacterium]
MSGLFPNAFHVARREYLFRVRGRAFKITTALLAVAVIGFTLVPSLLSLLGIDDPPEVAVYVEAEGLSADPVLAIQTVLAVGPGMPGDGDEEPVDPDDRARVTRTDDPDATAEQVRADELDGLLKITRPETDGDLKFEYVGSSSPTNTTSLLITQAASAIAISDRLERAGISAGESAELFAPADFTTTPADPDDVQNDDDFGGSLMLAYVVVILTFMAILTYGQWVAQSVAEEKSGRVMELLITAATPRQLLTGKVLGTGAAGLTQYLALIIAVAAGLMLNGPINDLLGVSGGAGGIEFPTIDPIWLLTFTAFFLLGFALYSTLYAAGGSMVSRIEDVQQAVGPLIYLALAGYFIAFAGLNDPDANWMTIASLVPFFSPYLMPARMLLGNPAAWEVVAALVILGLTLVLAIWIASRIYSAGVLMYGQRVGFRTIFRATRVSR